MATADGPLEDCHILLYKSMVSWHEVEETL
jgi:hypothetical protein